jgi:hypothetical protein
MNFEHSDLFSQKKWQSSLNCLYLQQSLQTPASFFDSFFFGIATYKKLLFKNLMQDTGHSATAFLKFASLEKA